MYGGHRLGDNLFGNTPGLRRMRDRRARLALPDRPSRPVGLRQQRRADPRRYQRDGRPVKAVVQLTKQAMAYVLRSRDRQAGLADRRAAGPQVEHARRADRAARSRFPTRPAPFDRHGLTTDDLIDFTPELRAEALDDRQALRARTDLHAALDQERRGPATPGARCRCRARPAAPSGAAPASTPKPGSSTCRRSPARSPPICCRAIRSRPNLRYTRGSRDLVEGPQGLPITKPPYGRITAINMNTGDHLWSGAERRRSARSSGAQSTESAAARPAEPRHAAADAGRCSSWRRAIR